MRIDEIEARKAEIRGLLEHPEDLDITALTEEVRALDAEAKEIRDRAAAEAELRSAVAPAVAAEITEKKEERKMDIEIRKSHEYAQAYLQMLKTGKDAECRALLTEQVSGSVPVPFMVEEEIKTAWEESQLMGLVKHSYFKGGIKVGFEKTATGAAVHVEGAAAPAEETLTLGIVTIANASIKKWITVSDEALEGTTADVLGYLYKEIAHKIVEAAEGVLIDAIIGAPDAATTTAVGVPAVTVEGFNATTIIEAISLLSAQAKDLHIVMNRRTYPAVMAVALNAGYAIDVFNGLKDRVVFSDTMPTIADGGTVIIVGDFGYGAQANFPAGDSVSIKVDDLSLAEKDLVKLVGRQYVGIGLVADKAFAKVVLSNQV